MTELFGRLLNYMLPIARLALLHNKKTIQPHQNDDVWAHATYIIYHFSPDTLQA